MLPVQLWCVSRSAGLWVKSLLERDGDSRAGAGRGTVLTPSLDWGRLPERRTQERQAQVQTEGRKDQPQDLLRSAPYPRVHKKTTAPLFAFIAVSSEGGSEKHHPNKAQNCARICMQSVYID